MIPVEHNWRYFFHFTDIRNLDSIIKNGLLCTNVKNRQGIAHQNIVNMTIQQRRATMQVTCGRGGMVHDYVPFYFTSKNPMFMAVLNGKNHDQPFIIYLCMRISRLERDDAVFTDASANTVNPPNFYHNTDRLTTLDWDAIDSRKWKYSEEERHRKMAEALIYDRVDITEIDAIVVYNKWVADGVRRIFARNGVQPPSIVLDGGLAGGRYRFFYTKYFISGRNHETLVTGPYFLLQDYRGLLAQIKRVRGAARRYRHANMAALLGSIAANFNCLPELQGINGLSTNNFIHNSTVYQHTLDVVANIQRTENYTAAGENDRNTLLLERLQGRY